MRNKHPYYMYDHIHGQPNAATSVAKENNEKIEQLAEAISRAARVFLVGTGTSYHAAWSSSFFVRNKYPEKHIQAVPSIDFALYEADTNKNDLVVVFSHRGTKQYSLQSLKKAQENGSHTVLVTGHNPDIDKSVSALIIETVTQEESSAHTISYMSSVVVVAAAAGADANAVSRQMQSSMSDEDKVKSFAPVLKNARRIWLCGSGPSEVLAHEIALKLKETAYLLTEGSGTEELIHGPFQTADENDVLS